MRIFNNNCEQMIPATFLFGKLIGQMSNLYMNKKKAIAVQRSSKHYSIEFSKPKRVHQKKHIMIYDGSRITGNI